MSRTPKVCTFDHPMTVTVNGKVIGRISKWEPEKKLELSLPFRQCMSIHSIPIMTLGTINKNGRLYPIRCPSRFIRVLNRIRRFLCGSR